jgi:hypothetical protein
VLLADTSIRCGNLFVPYRSLDGFIGRYVRALIFENNTPEYLYSRSGSCTLISFKGNRYCFLTKHQVADFDLNNAKIVKGSSGGDVFPLDTRWDVTPENEEEYEDLCTMRVSPSAAHSFEFFSLSPTETPSILNTKMLIAVGCPTSLSVINYEPNSIHIVTVTMPAQYEGASRNAAHLHTMKLTSNKDSPDFSQFDLDGLSGGAVFSLDGELRGYECNFRGIIVRGGNGFVHFIDAEFVRLMLGRIS